MIKGIALSVGLLAAVAVPVLIVCTGCAIDDQLSVSGITRESTPTTVPGRCDLCPACEEECIPHPCVFDGTLEYKNSGTTDYRYMISGMPGTHNWYMGKSVTKVFVMQQIPCGVYEASFLNFTFIYMGQEHMASGVVRFGCTVCPTGGAGGDG